MSTTLAPKHGFFFYPYAFHYNATAADKTTIFNNYRACLQRFQHTANTYATTQVYAFANLCTTANSCPGIHHGAFIYISANIYITGHQHYILCQVSAISCHCMRNSTYTQ